ncbi:helix-turn-helix domain-containing protein [Halorubrum lipolyticum]|uniref:Bacterio-opsin activator HTH domain protein n=1 Tax=Halorubrum lipolyticum DSM 21995 TaxID=1227482 RepID=M0P779_9EURY|nr:helix-turn-helix domain-containing protein [Halorubrum lipolyticum]EMA64700.1 Bacterio-opsin activator HTH domain protein [Halorubrum lipolyticum DSM 21995]
MTRLTLRLDFPSGSWLGDVSGTHPDATLRATETVAATEGEVTALAVAGADRAATVESLRAHDRVDRVDTVDRSGPATRLRVVAPAPPPHVAAAREVGLPIEEPVAVTDGRATLDVVGERSRLTAFGRRLAGEGVTVGIEASDADEEPVLTDAQRDLVLAAVAAGYYDTPRECTLTELAEARGLAKSTCSETLHRAEGRVLRRFVDGEFDGGDHAESGENAIVDDPDPDRDSRRPRSGTRAR